MTYIKLVIVIADEYQESLIAELNEMNFDGFQQLENKLVSYIMKENFDIDDREHIDQLLAGFPGECFIETEEIVAEQNWNEQWEQTIKAQEIGRFFVKPTWSEANVPEERILLEIDPKMSFGTGYHETTRLILKLLPDVVEEGDQVIDAGTGTGILSIAAIKLGAQQAFAFDIDEWSIENTRENILLNGVNEQITVKEGSAEVIPDALKADLLLANIERNTILELLPVFMKSTKKGGNIILSGLLETDEADVIDELTPMADIVTVKQENEWIAIHAQVVR
ncbi:50S ribosomal protein L11 methyltransferase [Fodinibius salsisoli]|uniref:Ribosomal protein L11 methyltransferase n=1 Tax=Fodinibius salsisoli TaxID=2820877 RepID=A0ABT3PR00_9BACT|nr:50S ribosomal protein L11 methyltransferase [Fodinibius salsisoli]MCW9708255.1 50S ribosomal protein L11 methyltransferase [Fodinibius salsisoli]